MNYGNLKLRTIQDLEKNVLCSMLANKDVLQYSVNTLMQDDFYFRTHSVVFTVMKELFEEGFDCNIDDIATILNKIYSAINIEAIKDIFISIQSLDPKKDILNIQENSMNRYMLKNKITKNNVVQIAIEDKYYHWLVMYVDNELYEVQTMTAGDIASEFQFTFSSTISNIKHEEFRSGNMLPWDEDTESISKYLFVR